MTKLCGWEHKLCWRSSFHSWCKTLSQKEMAQTGAYVPLDRQQNAVSQQQSLTNNTYVVVDQPPCRREVFPYRLPLNWIFGLSIVKCILGSLLFIFGIVNVAAVEYGTKIAFPIWCGLTVCTMKFSHLRPVPDWKVCFLRAEDIFPRQI